MEKLEYRICPECGKIYKVKHVDKIMLGYVVVRMQCENNHEWLEHYSMQYTGYQYKNSTYDRFGAITSEVSDTSKEGANKNEYY